MLVDEATYLGGKRLHESCDNVEQAFTWIGLIDPTDTELKIYQNRFSLNPLAIEDALSIKQRPKLDHYHEHSVLILKTINYDTAIERLILGELTIMFSNIFILTVRHGDAMPLRSIRADLENHPQRLAGGTTAVLHELVDRLVDQYVTVCSHLTEDVNQIEDDVFDDDEPASAAKLYFVKRELIEFRRAIMPLLKPIELLAAGKALHVNPDSAPNFSDVRDHLLKVVDEVEKLNELIDAALHANVALVQTQQNADMRKISAYVGIGAVPTMVAGIYGMNFKYLPELEWRYGYFIVLGALAVVSALLYRLFRKNDWL